MPVSSLLLSSAAHLACGVLLALVGYSLIRRPAPTLDQAHASNALGLWWYLFAATAILDGLVLAGAAGGNPPVHLALTLARLKILVGAAAVWGLAYYLVQLTSPEPRFLWLAVGATLVQTAGFLYIFQAQGPTGLEIGEYAVTVAMADPVVASSFLGALSYTLTYTPAILLGIGALVVGVEGATPTMRFRLSGMGMVAILWHVTAIAWSNPNATLSAALAGSLTVVYLASALIAVVAYFPPEPFQRTWGLISLSDECTGALRPPEKRSGVRDGAR